MKKKIRSLVFICCMVAVVAAGVVFGSNGSLQAAGFGGEKGTSVAAQTENVSSGAETDGSDGDLVIIEVHDTETPAANIQTAEEGPSYLGLAVCLAAVAVALFVAFLVLERKYGRLKQETRRLEDEVARLYSANSDL